MEEYSSLQVLITPLFFFFFSPINLFCTAVHVDATVGAGVKTATALHLYRIACL
jgi:hypothetical protein